MRIPRGVMSGACVFLLIGSVCLGSSRRGESRRVPTGTWGAVGIGLEVTGSGARIEYDCAHGTFNHPLLLDAHGRFDVKGLHFREHGGPIRDGEESTGRPVRYTGEVTGDAMTLTVRPEGSGIPIGSYKLVHGGRGRIHKCL